jgi:hypothetical protein
MRAQVILPHLSGLPRDSVVNTYTFFSLNNAFPVTPAAMLALKDRLISIYNDAPPGGQYGLGAYIGEGINRGGLAEVTVYDLGPAHPRTPSVWTWALRNGQGQDNGMPETVAMCISWKNVPPPGEKRRSGRVYIGPLRSTVVAAAGAHTGPSGVFITDMAQAGRSLMLAPVDPFAAMTGFVLGILSKKHANIRQATAVWVDNEFDRVGRRRQRATSRFIPA